LLGWETEFLRIPLRYTDPRSICERAHFKLRIFDQGASSSSDSGSFCDDVVLAGAASSKAGSQHLRVISAFVAKMWSWRSIFEGRPWAPSSADRCCLFFGNSVYREHGPQWGGGVLVGGAAWG
jgi:hypothetical protein